MHQKKGLKILIAPDKFKGSLSGKQVCAILKTELLFALSDAEVVTCPLADGGDGSVDILADYLDLQERRCHSVDPLGRPIVASYFTSDDTAFIELASCSGLLLLNEAERNPMDSSTYGTGLQIKNAIDLGMEQIYLFLGGSATNDGGIGIASALGYTFYDNKGKKLLPTGNSLNSIVKIIPPKEAVKIKKLTLCCDVINPPFGPKGAAFIYAKQKGANKEEIIKLDKGIEHFCIQIEAFNGAMLRELAGGGAAGGVAVALVGLLGAEIVSGIELISKISMFDNKVMNADLVISGEGKLDRQSLNGKVVSGVAETCKRLGKRFWLVVGKNELVQDEINDLGAEKVFSIFDRAEDIEDAMINSAGYLKAIGQEIAVSCFELL